MREGEGIRDAVTEWNNESEPDFDGIVNWIGNTLVLRPAAIMQKCAKCRNKDEKAIRDRGAGGGAVGAPLGASTDLGKRN